MADTSLTLSQLNILFQTLIMQMLGLTLTDASSSKVRISWPKAGMPAWQITEDIVFIQCLEIDDSYNRQREDINTAIDTENYNQATGYTTINSINLVVYGPNSYDNIKTIRDKMFMQEFRDILARSNVFINPDFPSPRRAPEFFEGQWWERVDLTMYFNELTIRNTTGKTIASAEIHVSDGVNEIISTIE